MADDPEDNRTTEDGMSLSTISRKRKRVPRLQDVARDIMKKSKLISTWKDKTYRNMCSTCQSLDITLEKFIIQDHSSDKSQQAYRSYLPQVILQEASNFPLGSGSGKYPLGALRDIRRKSGKCPFCYLVIKSLQDMEDIGDSIEDFDNSNEGGSICYASWQVDGRQPVRDHDGRVAIRARTRRIRLHWDNRAFHESYLVLITPETPQRFNSDEQNLWESDALFLGRSINSAVNNQVLVKRWLDICHGSHGESCEAKRGQDFEEMIAKSYFGVIDVHEMRLASLPHGMKYVALSYMWGEGKLYTSDLSNIRKHQAPGGIGKVFLQLPRVIQDAIQLVRSLGERYLWVDSLCIVQDSALSWSLNAKAMDLVYGNAHLTICAADGEGATTGLKGLAPSERYTSQHIEECAQGVRLMVSHLAETYVRRSTWNKRAWTFQERLLSKRCMIFAGGRVYFQCRCTTMSEDIITEVTAPHKDLGWSIELVHAPLQMLHGLESHPFRAYTACVELYSSRILGRPKDILAAFQGMSNLIGKALGDPLVFGLPSSHFDLALLWEPQDAPRRRLPVGPGEFDGMEFPSWSWCGWMDATLAYKNSTIEGCLSDVHRWLTKHTWISWYIRDGQGSLRPVWDAARHTGEEGREGRWKGYREPPPSDDAAHDKYGRTLSPEISQLTRSEFKRTLPEFPYRVSIAEPSDKQSHDQRFLQFWTWSAFLRLIPHTQSPASNLGAGLCRYDIADYTGDWCGTIVLGREWGDAQKPGADHEFIAIVAILIIELHV